MSRHSLSRPWTVLFLAAIVGATGCATKVSPVKVEAARTAARVKTALVNDPLVGTRPIAVVVGEDGVAQLSGRVGSEAEATRAVELARAVPGVARVVTRLQVGAEPPAPVDVSPGTGAVVEPLPPLRGPALEFEELEDDRTLLALGMAMLFSNDEGSRSDTRTKLWPIVRLGSGPGLGPALGFDWYDVAPPAPERGPGDVGRLRIRPVMAGLRYTVPMGRVSIAPSLVGGVAFNSLEVADTGAAEQLAVDVANSFVWRASVSVWVETSRRTAFHASIGRVMANPRFTVVEQGRLAHQRASADATVMLVGIAYTLF
ncbi:MAG: BON domain-containing protein [Acidobacteria bacterium]|nr:BON domain-containing protein [Acidobacteriota bacterium]